LIIHSNHRSLFFLILFIFLGSAMYLLQLTSAILVLILFLEVFFLVRFRNDSCTFIFLIYNFIHFYVFIDFFWFRRKISFWTDFQNSETMNSVLFIYYLFFISFAFLLNNIKSINYLIFLDHFKQNSIYFFTFILLAIISMIYGVSGENIVQSNGYAQSLEMSKTSLFEYSILLYLVGLLFIDRRNFVQTGISICFTLAFIARSLLYGGRIEVLEIAMLNIFYWFIIPNLLKWKHIIFFSVCGMIFFQIFGFLRENPSLVLAEKNINNEIFTEFFSSFFSKTDTKSSTEGDVIQSSARLVGMVDTGILKLDERIISMISFLFSPISYFFSFGELSNLSTYKQSRFISGGGGGVFAYFYVWLGFIGPVVGGILLSMVFNITKNKFSKYWFIYFMSAFTTFPRWYSYNPIFFLKFCILPVLIYFIISLFRKYINAAKS
jgi:hypothetical protein